MEAVTLTFGNRAENHRNMQVIGEKAVKGLGYDELLYALMFFESKGIETVWFDLNDILDEEKGEDAYILIAKNGVSLFVDPNDLLTEQKSLEKDKKALMYGRVVNKKARHNLCFADFDQEPDYQQGKGRVYSFSKLPFLNRVREALPNIVGDDCVRRMPCEGNYYYDTKKTYIGFHGDTEREIVMAVRLGADFNLYYQWFKQGKEVGRLLKINLSHGDMYFMSEKAVGTDWKSKNKLTLRHAASLIDKLILK